MRFKITNNNGTQRYIQAQSNKIGDEVEERLRLCCHELKIKSYQRLEFDKVEPDDIMKLP